MTPPRRKPLPDHLPHEDVLLGCGGQGLRLLWRHVACHRRERQRNAGLGAGAASCRAHRPPEVRLPRLQQGGAGAAPERLIAGGLATPALLAQVLVSKYCDHTPLYRQSQIFAGMAAMVNEAG
jgi:transposase